MSSLNNMIHTFFIEQFFSITNLIRDLLRELVILLNFLLLVGIGVMV
jgi:hypothetical protein